MNFLPTLASLSLVLSRTNAAPNVILVVLDDMPFLDQWKESAPADLVDALDAGFPTPHIDAFRDEAVIFSKSFCGAPKCAPSRYSLLTGRQPTRCKYVQDVQPSGIEGPWVSVYSQKMTAEDAKHSIPYVLKNDPVTPYHTGMPPDCFPLLSHCVSMFPSLSRYGRQMAPDDGRRQRGEPGLRSAQQPTRRRSV